VRTLTFGFLNLNYPPAANAPPLEVIDAAAAAGFDSVGLRITGRRPEDAYVDIVGNAAALREVKDRSARAGLRLSSMTGYGFFPDVPLDAHARVLDATARLGCDLIVLNVYYEDQDAFADALARLCERAAGYGVRVGVEFMPFSGLRTLAQAQRAVSRTGAPNAGYVIDALHLMRSGGTPRDVATLDPARIFLGQLCDAKARDTRPTDDELRAEARAHRLYPGEGDAPLHALLDVLPPALELEIEVPRSDQAGLSLAERAHRAAEALRGYMQAYERARA
jgi:sugar phosphate isomerase/epimerase